MKILIDIDEGVMAWLEEVKRRTGSPKVETVRRVLRAGMIAACDQGPVEGRGFMKPRVEGEGLMKRYIPGVEECRAEPPRVEVAVAGPEEAEDEYIKDDDEPVEPVYDPTFGEEVAAVRPKTHKGLGAKVREGGRK